MLLSSSNWLWLLIAILFGVLGTISMKLSDGLQKFKPSMCLIIFYIICFFALTLTLQGVDVSIVYAMWSGIGTILVAIVGILMFHESISIQKVISLLLIVAGVLGIDLSNVIH